MRLQRTTASAILLGTLACSSRLPGVEDDDGTSVGETGTDSNEDNENEDDPEPECVDDSDCPENFVCIGGEYCEPLDIGPCDSCTTSEACIENECVPIQGLPACGAIEAVGTETFVLPGTDGDFALAELDGEPGLELVGISPTQAIAWIDGAAVESPLALTPGSWLQAAALLANEDELVDLVVVAPSTDWLYQLAGDGAGGFAVYLERYYGSLSPWDVTRLRTGAAVDGMVVETSDGVQQQSLYFDILTNNLPDQVLDGVLERWVVDVEGDGVDELIVGNHDMTAMWRFDGDLFVEATQLEASFELPSKDPWTETKRCQGFAAGDLDADADADLVCMITHYAGSEEHGALVPYFHAGDFVFERGEVVVVETGGPGAQVSFFDLEGDGSPELLLGRAVVDIGPSGSFDCASPHGLGLGKVGNLDGDAADEVVSWGAPQAPHVYDLSW